MSAWTGRRARLLASLAPFALSLGCAVPQGPITPANGGEPEPAPPNILIIVADDLGYGDVSFTGGSIATPNIDRIARSGMQLERFYVAPLCSPTRAGLLTGRYPHRFGIMGETVSPGSDFGMAGEEVTLAEVLAQAGYERRFFIGKWHLGNRLLEHHPMSQGFTSFYGMLNGEIDYFTHKRWGEVDWHRDFGPSDRKGYATDLLSRETARIIEAGRDSDSPWFIWLAYNAPHTPFQATEADLAAEGLAPGQSRHRRHNGGEGGAFPDPDYALQGRGNTQRQTVRAMVRAMDRGIGQVLDALERSGQLENTLILFTSDNGGAGPLAYDNGPLRSWKTTHFEGGVRVAAAISWPARLQPRESADVGPVSYVDVLPTLAALAGASLPARDIDGIDVSDELLERRAIPDRTLFLGEDYRDRAERRGRADDRVIGRDAAVLEGRWKLIGDMLFDVVSDPAEMTDVAERHPDIVARLAQQRKAYLLLRRVPRSAIRGGKAKPPPKHWQGK